MAQFVTLKAEGLQALRTIDERLVSYNVEMTEVTGGTFWKAYSEAQVDGTLSGLSRLEDKEKIALLAMELAVKIQEGRK